MNAQINIAILGSTGSIGRQTLDIIAEYPNLFRAYMLVARRSADLLIEQARRFKPRVVIIADESLYTSVREALQPLGIIVETGDKAISDRMTDSVIDTVVTAMVGYSGLAPTIAAIHAGKDIALANKETLVVAGEMIMQMLQKSRSRIYPVDSEHGAFYQCLVGERHDDIDKLILTASGGPFRNTPAEQLPDMKAADALRHPNWDMGAKITIDSATMMNKGFEMIEAQWLYDIAPERIEIVVHPQSIVHSMVQFRDGSVKAQLGLPDMHLPIRYALGLPDRRLYTDRGKMTLADYANLTFEAPDFERFPLLDTAYRAAETGGNAPCVINAANEVAVAAFLNDRIRFTDIHRAIEYTLEHASFSKQPTLDNYVNSNAEARRIAQQFIDNLNPE